MSYKSGFWTVRRAATWLDCDPKTIRRAIKAGTLRSLKLGRQHRVTKVWLLQWLGAKLEGPWGRPADWRAPDGESGETSDAIEVKTPGSKAVN